VVQISLNIPGIPKRIEGDSGAIIEARNIFLAELGIKPVFEASLSNYSGLAIIMAYSGTSCHTIKKIAVETEECGEAGRVFDIDVITRLGQISRADLGMNPRKCILCAEDAKVCARAQRHPAIEVRSVIRNLLSGFLSVSTD
jgi:holo-ACP synthase